MMKILIMSDTHGYDRNALSVIDREGPVDCLLHLGDVMGSESRLEREARKKNGKCQVYMVAGNCDFFSSLPTFCVTQIGGHRFFLTHGHRFSVSMDGTEYLAAEARLQKCDIAVFGHTHKPLIEEDSTGMLILNPGSLTYPRGQEREPTYMVLTLSEDGSRRISLKKLQ